MGAIQGSELRRGIFVRNESGSEIAAGKLVYVSGWDETTKRWLISLADADVAGAQAQFVTREAIANNANGFAYYTARITGLDTSGASVGDPYYLSATAGAGTLTAPTGAGSIRQVVGRVAVVHASTGEVEFDLRALNLERVGTNELQDDAVTSAKIDETVVQAVKVTLSAANIIAMNATPVTLIAAPGANKAIIVDEAVFHFQVGATQFTAGGAVSIEYADANDNLLASTLAASVITGASDAVRKIDGADGSLTVTANKAVEITNATAAFADGDGTMDVYLRYRVLTLS